MCYDSRFFYTLCEHPFFDLYGSGYCGLQGTKHCDGKVKSVMNIKNICPECRRLGKFGTSILYIKELESDLRLEEAFRWTWQL